MKPFSYLRKQMNHEGWVSIHIIAGFNRLRTPRRADGERAPVLTGNKYNRPDWSEECTRFKVFGEVFRLFLGSL